MRSNWGWRDMQQDANKKTLDVLEARQLLEQSQKNLRRIDQLCAKWEVATPVLVYVKLKGLNAELERLK